MKTLRPTLYYLALESDYSQDNKNGVFRDIRGKAIYRASSEFLAAAAMEGSARTIDGRVLNYAGGPKGAERFRWIEGAAYGLGAKCALVPLRSIAVDPNVIPLGSIVKIPRTRGLVLPDGTIHDGIWYALDVGGAIKGDRVDIFAGVGRASMKQLYSHGIDHLKPLEYEIQGKLDGCPTPYPFVQSDKEPKSQLDKVDLIQSMSETYRSYLGQSETHGANRSPLIDEINRFMKVQLGSPYCLSGLQWGLEKVKKEFECDFDIPLTAHCQTFYNKTPDRLKHQTPAVGDWGIYKRVGSSKGHAVFVSDIISSDSIKTIEFNTGPEKEMNRDGGGVYEKTRKIAGTGLMRLMGFVRVVDSAT